MVSTTSYILVGLMNLFSFCVMGITGFGATVLSQPTNIALLGLSLAIPFSTLVTFPCQIYLGIKTVKNVAWKQLGKILLIATPGLVVGQQIAQYLDQNVSKVVIGTFITIIAIKGLIEVFIKNPKLIKAAQEKDPTRVIDDVETVDTTFGKVMRYVCLFFGGMMQGAYVIGGPLITVYVLSAIKDKTKFRNTMNWLWIFLNCVFNFSSQLSKGMYNQEGLWTAVAIGAVAAFIGYFIGIKVHDKLSKQFFLKVTYVMLFITGTTTFYAAIQALGVL
ncbi:sulfite exporter TauE/SafE family protein [Chakrabartyella piscis]|uniref:sulfite exporter TauE/SafE family protein n=1 Tax=Chakrabartyella piscis TaxID=2918914 RepID=UPI002958CD0E|nr:sulfite exporter TauE/SafE family protein [Chakrabartyella piscis]